MRKFTFILMTLVAIGVKAQKATTRYQFTESRMPQVLVEPLVKPLVVEVEVLKQEDPFFKLPLAKDKVESELEGKIENIYNYGIFIWTQKSKSDMIVGATYNFYTNPAPVEKDGSDFYILEIKGFPGKFINWHTATREDYEWMRIRHEGANNPVVKPLK